MDEPKILYRFTWVGAGPYKHLYKVIRETPKCFYIEPYSPPGEITSREPLGVRRVLKKQSGKRYAYLTEEMAMDSFQRRAVARVKHLDRQLYNAKEILVKLRLPIPKAYTPSQIVWDEYC